MITLTVEQLKIAALKYCELSNFDPESPAPSKQPMTRLEWSMARINDIFNIGNAVDYVMTLPDDKDGDLEVTTEYLNDR